jgi:hypothetical protein
MSRLRKAFALSASDWLLIAQTWLWFVAVEVGLGCLPLQKLLRIIQRPGKAQRGTKREEEPRHATPERLAYCVGLTTRLHLHDPTCLKKALVLYTLLTRRDFNAQLFIGAARATNGKLDAHAWLECQGKVLLGAPVPGRYSILCTLADATLHAAQAEAKATS